MSLRAKRRPTSKIAWAALIGMLASFVGLGVYQLPMAAVWEGGTFNERASRLAHDSAFARKIRLVYLDQASLDWGENENEWRWPWNRELYGAMTDFFTAGGAASVTFDVIYSEDSVYGVEDDESFGQALKRHGRTVAAMLVSDKARKSMKSSWPDAVPAPPVPAPETPLWKTALAASFPVATVATNATRLGTVNSSPDRDGVFRSLPLATVFDGRHVPSLGVATFLLDHGAIPPATPLRRDGSVILRFANPASIPPAYSAAAVLKSHIQLQEGTKPEVDPGEFKDCHVFFGFSAEGLKDLRPTPLDPAAPGVMLHATMLENLLSNRFIREVPHTLWGPVSALLAALCAGWALFNSSWRGHVPTLVVAVALPWGVGFAAYTADAWWPVIPGLIATLSATAAGILFNYATEGRQKEFIRQAFGRFVSPLYIEELVKNPDKLQLGGEKRELSIFFSDLAGFSSFSERLSPAQLTTVLNEYFTAMTDIINEEGGTLDKYIGDAIVAFWNAPLAQPDHAARAVRAAIRCQQKLEELRPYFRTLSDVDLNMRIGINTGEVIVGNFGSRKNFNYTVLGDTANLASRLEGANKSFGTLLMVAETTWRQLGGAVPGRLLARLRVVGRTHAVPVYEPFSSAPPPAEVLSRYQQGLEKLEGGDLAAALALFEANPDDPPSRKHVAAVKAWMRDPSGFDKGVWNLTSK